MKYNVNFQDNISPEEFNSRASGILGWIKENRELYDWAKDPNAYELTNVFLFAGKYASEGHDIDLDTIKEMWEIRSEDFESKNNFVYQICKRSFDSAISKKPLVNDESSHAALRKAAGIGLFLAQQHRDKSGSFDYNNLGELLEFIKNASALKQRHPKLHNEFRFNDTIKLLHSLQSRHLDAKSKATLDKSVNEYVMARRR